MTITQTEAAPPKARWTGERIARLGFLIGLGWEATDVAADPIIATTANNVCRQAHRFGVAFRAFKRTFGGEHVKLAAEKRCLTTEALARLLLREIAADPTLIDNILDDGLSHLPQPSNKGEGNGIHIR